MEQMYAQALNLIDTFAQKQRLGTLCEFEYKLFEQLCESMAVYFGGLRHAFRSAAMRTEMEAATFEPEYLAWLAAYVKDQADKEKPK